MVVAPPPRCRPFRPGFTLLELLTTLALVAALAAIASAVIGSTMTRSARLRAQADLSSIATALEAFRRHYGNYPRTDDPVQLLDALAGRRGPDAALAQGPNLLGTTLAITPGSAPLLEDPWGSAYRYRYDPSREGEYALWSAGPDGRDHLGADDRPVSGHPVNADNVGPQAR